jgi:hypothetical protein
MRRPEGPKGAGLEAILALARRSPRHSSLFWFLFDQHDQLIEAKRQSGLGIPWESMLPRFAALNLTLCQGKAITLRGARQTFLRVQKKKARLAALEAKAEAERAFQRARDPRQNMPSRRSVGVDARPAGTGWNGIPALRAKARSRVASRAPRLSNTSPR